MGIERPVIHGKQPVRLPPAARGELKKAAPYAASHRVARKEYMAFYASVFVRAENMSVHGTTASVNQATRTCTPLFYKGGINRLQNLVGGPSKTLQKKCCGV